MLHTFIVALFLQQDDPYAIVKKMREKLAAAKTIHIVEELRFVDREGTLRLELWIKGSDRYRMRVQKADGPERIEGEAVSDGARVCVEGELPIESGWTKMPTRIPARVREGPLTGFLLPLVSLEEIDAEDLKLAGSDKEGHRLEYEIMDGSMGGTTWVDAATHLPVRVKFAGKHGESMEVTVAVALDKDLPDELFVWLTKGRLARATVKQVARSIELYQTYKGRPPRSLDDLAGEFVLGAVPKDPWGRPFLYEPGKVRSLGADGKEGGEGENADLAAEIASAGGSAIVAPTPRLLDHFAARLHVQLLAAAVRAYQETYEEYPSSLGDLVGKPSWAAVAPESGFVSAVPKDATGKDYVYKRDKATVSIRCADRKRIPLKDLTDDERRKLSEASQVALTPAEEAQFKRLLDQIRDDDPEVRQTAVTALERIGKHVAPRLEEALAGEKDPEAAALLKALCVQMSSGALWQRELGAPAIRLAKGHGSRAEQDACMNNLSQLWKMMHNYRVQFGGRAKLMPSETGADFWLVLARTTPPLIDASLADIFFCPASGEEPEAGKCRYGGPKSDVNVYMDGDPVGMCDDPAHGDEVIILRKSGDVMKYKRSDPLYKTAREKLQPPPDE